MSGTPDTVATGLTVEVRHVPDVHTPEEAQRPNPRGLGPGFYEFGVVFNGVFIPLESRRAGGVDADVERLGKTSKSKG